MPIARGFPFRADHTRRLFNEISKLLVPGSTAQRCESSFPATVSSDIPVKKGQKRVTTDERKAMVESFVNKYRAMNSGKFPTASQAKKEVGGSYYFIRKILQELEYKLKMPSINTKISSGIEFAKEDDSSTEFEEVTSSQMTIESSTESQEVSHNHLMDARLHKDAQPVAVIGLDMYDSNKQYKLEKRPQTSTGAEYVNLEEVAKTRKTGNNTDSDATETHLLKGTTEDLHPCPKNPEQKVTVKTTSKVAFDSDDGMEDLHPCLKKPEQKVTEKMISEVAVDLEVAELKAEHNEQTELEKSKRDSSESKNDEDHRKKPSMWGNLKSLANGIIDVWRKL